MAYNNRSEQTACRIGVTLLDGFWVPWRGARAKFSRWFLGSAPHGSSWRLSARKRPVFDAKTILFLQRPWENTTKSMNSMEQWHFWSDFWARETLKNNNSQRTSHFPLTISALKASEDLDKKKRQAVPRPKYFWSPLENTVYGMIWTRWTLGCGV